MINKKQETTEIEQHIARVKEYIVTEGANIGILPPTVIEVCKLARLIAGPDVEKVWARSRLKRSECIRDENWPAYQDTLREYKLQVDEIVHTCESEVCLRVEIAE